MTALFLAASNGHVGVINELLKAKSIIVDLPDNHKMTPLSIAVRKRHTAVVAALPKQIIDCQRRLVSNADSTRDKLP